MKRALFFPLLIFSFVFLNAQKSNLFGSIKDAETGLAVPGSKVFLLKSFQGDLANQEGEYQISRIRKGKYNLICESEGYITDTVFGFVIKGKYVEKSFKLTQLPCKPRIDKESFADFLLEIPDSISLTKAQKGFQVSLQFSARFGEKFAIFRTWGLRDREIVLSLHRVIKMDCEPLIYPDPPYYAEELKETLRLNERGNYRINIFSDDFGKSIEMRQLVIY